MVESASKGAVLLFSKEAILQGCTAVHISESLAGFIAGDCLLLLSLLLLLMCFFNFAFDFVGVLHITNIDDCLSVA